MGFSGWFFCGLVLFSSLALAQQPVNGRAYPANRNPYNGNGYAAPAPGRLNNSTPANVPAVAPGRLGNPANATPVQLPAAGAGQLPAAVPGQVPAAAPAVAAPVLAANPAVAVVPANPNAIYQSFEQLIRYEVALLTEAEITHATGVRIPADIAKRLKPGSWEERVFYTLLAPNGSMYSPDTLVFSSINQLKAYTLSLLGVWSVDPRNSEQLVIALKKVNNSYLNAMSAVRFYLWAISGRPGNSRVYIGNMVRYVNMVQQTIMFLRNEQSIQYQAPTEFVDNGIAPIQQPEENKPYPIYVPSQTVNPQTKQNEPNYAEGEVIAPNETAVK